MAAFDPYRDWLNIQDYRRPPDHYALLGLQRYEQDLDKIRRSADARKSAVRSIRPGRHVTDWQKLLDEIEVARGCLLSETDKQVYDRQLREQPTEDESVFEDAADKNASTAASSLIAESEEFHLERAQESEVDQQEPATQQPVTNPLPPPLDEVPTNVGQPEPPESTPVESWTKNLLPPSLDTPSQTTADPAADSRSATVSSAADTVAGASPPGKLLMPPGAPAVAGAEGAGVAADTKPEEMRPGLTLPRASGGARPKLTSSLSLDQLLPPMAQPAVPANSPHVSSVPTAVPVATPVAVVAAAPNTATLEPQIAEPESSSATLFPATLPSEKYRRPKNNRLVTLAVVVCVGVLAYAAYAFTRNGSVDRDQGGSIDQVAVNGKEESQNPQNGLSGNDQPDQRGTADDVGAGNSANDEPETQNESSLDTDMRSEGDVSTEDGPPVVEPGRVVEPGPVVDLGPVVNPGLVVDPDPEEDWTPGGAHVPTDGKMRPEEGDTDPQKTSDSPDPQPMMVEPTEPEPAEPTEPEPPEPTEPEPPELTEAQRTELFAALDEVKRSLATRDLAAASRSRDRAEALALEAPGPHADKVHRMSLLCDYVHEFWDAVRAGMPGVEGKDLKVKNVLIHVVEANEQGILYRYSGKNYRKAFYEMHAELVLLIGEQWLEDTPTSRIFVGAFMAVEPKFGPKKAREEWEAALQGGAEVEELIPILNEL